MVWLALSILCSTSIALILKLNSIRRGNTLWLLLGNYLAASLISLYYLASSRSALTIYTIVFGSILGIMFVVSIYAYSKSVYHSGAALSTVSSRISVSIPVLLSIFMFSEMPSIFQTIGLILSLVTILFFYLSIKSNSSSDLNYSSYIWLIILFMGIGLNDAAINYFTHKMPADEGYLFLSSIFLSALIITLMTTAIKKSKFEFSSFYLGVVLGIPNLYASFFILWALAELPGIIVFPILNISIILITTIVVTIIWKEKLNKMGIASIAIGIIAIILLNI